MLAAKEAIAQDPSIRNRKKIAETIEVNGETARLSRRLVEIDRRAPVVVPLGRQSIVAESVIVEGGGAQRARPVKAAVGATSTRMQSSKAGTVMQQELFSAGADSPESGDAGGDSEPVRASEITIAAESFVSLDSLTDAALLEAITWKGPRSAELQELVSRFEFGSLVGDLRIAVAPKPAANQKYHTILAADFPAWLKRFEAVSSFAFDTETTSLDPFKAKLIGVSVCWSDDEAFYIPLAHTEPQSEKLIAGQVAAQEFLARVQPIFANPKVEKRGQNLKYDLSVLS